jgi:hypothetical protein
MMDRAPSPRDISGMSATTLRAVLADARTLLMYGQTAAERERAMTTIERITTELDQRGVPA